MLRHFGITINKKKKWAVFGLVVLASVVISGFALAEDIPADPGEEATLAEEAVPVEAPTPAIEETALLEKEPAPSTEERVGGQEENSEPFAEIVPSIESPIESPKQPMEQELGTGNSEMGIGNNIESSIEEEAESEGLVSKALNWLFGPPKETVLIENGLPVEELAEEVPQKIPSASEGPADDALDWLSDPLMDPVSPISSGMAPTTDSTPLTIFKQTPNTVSSLSDQPLLIEEGSSTPSSIQLEQNNGFSTSTDATSSPQVIFGQEIGSSSPDRADLGALTPVSVENSGEATEEEGSDINIFGIDIPNPIKAVKEAVKDMLYEEMKWLMSYQTVTFDTPDGDLDMGQYALDPGGDGYLIRTKPKNEANFIHVDLDHDVSGLEEVKVKCDNCAYYSEFRSRSGKIIRVPYNKEDYDGLRYKKNYPQPSKRELKNPFRTKEAEAALAYDNDNDAGASGSIGSVNWSLDVSGDDVALVVGCGIDDIIYDDITDVKWNGSSITDPSLKVDVSSTGAAEVWYGTDVETGNHTVSVTFAGNVDGYACNAVSITGADTTDAKDAGNTASGSVTADDFGVTVTTQTTDAWLVGTFFIAATGSSISPNYTELYEYTIGISNSGGSAYRNTTGSAGDYSIDWYDSGSFDNWGVVAIAIKPLGGGSDPCAPPDSGSVWNVALSDYCYITDYRQFNGTLNCFGSGRFAVASGGEVVVEKVNCPAATVVGTGKLRMMNIP